MTPLQVLIASNGTKNKSNAPSSPGVTQRNTTLCSNQQTCIDYLIDSGANVYSQDYYGLTAMHYAAIKDNFNGAKYMIDKTQKPIKVDV
jgi:ankyrin repeat protein